MLCFKLIEMKLARNYNVSGVLRNAIRDELQDEPHGSNVNVICCNQLLQVVPSSIQLLRKTLHFTTHKLRSRAHFRKLLMQANWLPLKLKTHTCSNFCEILAQVRQIARNLWEGLRCGSEDVARPKHIRWHVIVCFHFKQDGGIEVDFRYVSQRRDFWGRLENRKILLKNN